MGNKAHYSWQGISSKRPSFAFYRCVYCLKYRRHLSVRSLWYSNLTYRSVRRMRVVWTYRRIIHPVTSRAQEPTESVPKSLRRRWCQGYVCWILGDFKLLRANHSACTSTQRRDLFGKTEKGAEEGTNFMKHFQKGEAGGTRTLREGRCPWFWMRQCIDWSIICNTHKQKPSLHKSAFQEVVQNARRDTPAAHKAD